LKIKSDLDKIIGQFLRYFESREYTISPSSELITDDETILFTNDTITPWKSFLVERNIPEQGLCMRQPSLRLQGLRDTICEENKLELVPERFLGYFNALGILTGKPKREIQLEILELLLGSYSISPRDVRVYAQKDMEFLDEIGKTIEVTNDSNPKIYYQWGYGLEGIIGRGATFTLLQRENDPQEIGQLIQIQDSSGELIGYEFGFGAETFLSRKNNNKVYSAWSIYDAIEEKHLCFKTLLDNYSSLGAILSIPSNLMGERHKTEKDKILRNISLLQHTFSLSTRWSESVLRNFLQLEFDKRLGVEISRDLDFQHQ
jgi:hypothetical protein|tara:strand:- start:28716 stop:29666 length:951 start_codon:yes stop_codon:yes gene_type:complete